MVTQRCLERIEKMVKVTVEVTNKELDVMEDLAVAWNLCNKHKIVHDASEEENFRFTQTCKKCVKINKEIRGKTLHLWSKLVTGYIKATNRGRTKSSL